MRVGTVVTDDGRVRTVATNGDGRIHDVTTQLGSDLARAFAQDKVAGLDPGASDGELESGAFRWLPPIPAPRRVLCTGFNFRSHALESAREVPQHPTFFVRFPSSFVGHEEPVTTPRESDTLDWEGEVAVVVGRAGRRLSVAQAPAHIAGYTLLADNSVREYQLHGSQATAGKNFDACGSWGPWIISADEAPDPHELAFRTLVNGVEMQTGRLADLVFGVAELIAYASSFTTLEAGDVIATGTPHGIGMRRDPPVYLRPGDRLTIELDGLLSLSNPVIAG